MQDLIVTVAVEGPSDEAIVRRLLEEAGIGVAHVHGLKGKAWLDQNLAGYNRAAQYAPWLVVRDLDSDADCAPKLKATLLAQSAAHMALRIAVRSVEAWLLADAEKLSEFLRVPATKLPKDPDAVDRPKQLLVNLARQSRNREIRRDMVPASGTSGTQGPAYTARIIEFAMRTWRPRIAAKRSESLRRCIRQLRAWRS